MTMSVHDALEAWQQGRIDRSRAIALTGAFSDIEMLEMCVSNDVDILLPLDEEEQRSVDRQRSMLALYVELDALEPDEER